MTYTVKTGAELEAMSHDELVAHNQEVMKHIDECREYQAKIKAENNRKALAPTLAGMSPALKKMVLEEEAKAQTIRAGSAAATPVASGGATA